MISASKARDIERRYKAAERFRQRYPNVPFEETGFPSNDEISALEVYRFMTEVPDHVFVYYDEDFRNVHTWTGEHLGTIVSKGVERRPFGGRVVSVRVRAINGAMYGGICNLSSGTYCRLRKLKGGRR